MNRVLGYFAGFVFLIFWLWMLWIFVVNLQDADSSIKSGLIGLLSMILVAIIAHYQTKKREIYARHFAEKRTMYMSFMDLLFDSFAAARLKSEIPNEKMIVEMMKFKKFLIIWGGPQIIDAWNKYELMAQRGPKPEEMIKETEKLLREIRKDLGHNDNSLKFGNLFGLILVAKDKEMALGGE